MPPELVILHPSCCLLNFKEYFCLPRGVPGVWTPPPAMDILMEAFAVQYTVHAMPGANNIIQLGAPPLIDWKSNTCKQEGKRTTNSHNLACLELKFMTSDLSDTLLEEPDLSIMSTNKVILPLLGGRAPAFEEAIEWLQFYFVGDHTGA